MNARTLVFLRRGESPGEVLLGMKKAGFGAGKFAGFGGGVQPGESVAAAAVRELQEESGVRVCAGDLIPAGRIIFRFPARPGWNQVVHVFLVQRWQGQPQESSEMLPAWHSLERLPFEHMWADAPRWLPTLLAGRHILAEFTFHPDNETLAAESMREAPRAFGWETCPQDVRRQVEGLLERLLSLPGCRLQGLYLHGSLAMGCFNPRRSDLDLLAVCAQPLEPDARRQFLQFLLDCSGQPAPIEISLLAQAHLRPWRHPAPYDLHYSEAWRGRTLQALAEGSWRQAGSAPALDPDLAAHITLTRARGVRLFGAPIPDAFPPVPPQDLRASLAPDLRESLNAIDANPVYALLNCCRSCAWLQDGSILSKQEGGRRALQFLPAALHPAVRLALSTYRGAAPDASFEPAALQEFAAHMRRTLTPILEA